MDEPSQSEVVWSSGVLDQLLTVLRCSLCGASFAREGSALRCTSGHSFDIARQGYVNLLHARVPAGTADTAEMVAARAEFLGAGHYAPLADAVVRACAGAGTGLVVDAGAGTGYYLAKVLDALPDARGLALDVSAVALRRAARAHARAAAVVWNLWHPLPLESACASLVINVFAPRNGPEFRRILAADGKLVVVTPTRAHLAELAAVAPMLAVDPDKERRLAGTLDEHFTLAAREEVAFPLVLSAAEARTLVGMGPGAHHLARGALAGLPATVLCSASCHVDLYRPRAERS